MQISDRRAIGSVPVTVSGAACVKTGLQEKQISEIFTAIKSSPVLSLLFGQSGCQQLESSGADKSSGFPESRTNAEDTCRCQTGETEREKSGRKPVRETFPASRHERKGRPAYIISSHHRRRKINRPCRGPGFFIHSENDAISEVKGASLSQIRSASLPVLSGQLREEGQQTLP